MMPKYMQVVWLYLIGLLIIIVGIIMLVNSPGPMSFVVMLVGLAVAAIGAAHGRKMRMTGQFDMDQMKEEGPPEGVDEKPQPEDFPQEEEAPPEEEPEEPKQVPSMGGGFRRFLASFRRRQDEPLSEEEIMQLEIDDIKEGKIVPTEADIIEFMCPVCSAANEERNYFCFKCGNKLRRKTPEEDGEGRTHLKVEPGSIEIVNEQRVAKVIMCPDCNTPNKVRNKFCWSCGKKIRSDALEEKRAKSEKAIAPRTRKRGRTRYFKAEKKVKQFKK
ncbi:MAG: zinc ribbon domain-containing protein [Candidatus Aenigmatarchaeota archaeon]|nr:MAG: zinc ribbon domain-containing protein [Candidatus Aenigmarchaeota archaeon]